MEFENLGAKSDSAVVVRAPLPGAGGKTVVGVVRTRMANILERVIWTGIQAGIASFLVTIQATGVSGWRAAGLAALSAAGAAAISAVKNVIATSKEG